MEEYFHGIKIDKTELARVKELKKEKAKGKDKGKSGKKADGAKVLVESDDFIAFVLSEPEEEEVKPVGNVKAESTKDLTLGKRSEQPNRSSPKKLKIDTLLYKGMPWIDGKRTGGYSHQPTERLHEEIVDFINWMGPTEEERYARDSCVQRVKDLVGQTWPEALVEVFGSLRTQFYVPSSDIDLVIMFPDDEERAPLKKLAALLKKNEVAEEGSIQVVAKARVPIVKYVDRLTAYPVDISFNVTSGTESGDLVSRYSAQFPALRPLTLLVKHFLEMRGLNEVYSGGIGSYTVTCMVLSFLQVHPLVQAEVIRPHENLGVMLLEFLELYGKHFNYDQVGLAVNPQVPGEFYYDKVERGWLNDSRPGTLSVEDPQNRENDISKGSFSFHLVRQSLDHGHNVLLAAMGEFERTLMDIHRGRQKASPNEFSLLASIIRLSDKLLRHRHFVQSTTNI